MVSSVSFLYISQFSTSCHISKVCHLPYCAFFIMITSPLPPVIDFWEALVELSMIYPNQAHWVSSDTILASVYFSNGRLSPDTSLGCKFAHSACLEYYYPPSTWPPTLHYHFQKACCFYLFHLGICFVVSGSVAFAYYYSLESMCMLAQSTFTMGWISHCFFLLRRPSNHWSSMEHHTPLESTHDYPFDNLLITYIIIVF